MTRISLICDLVISRPNNATQVRIRLQLIAKPHRKEYIPIIFLAIADIFNAMHVTVRFSSWIIELNTYDFCVEKFPKFFPRRQVWYWPRELVYWTFPLLSSFMPVGISVDRFVAVSASFHLHSDSNLLSFPCSTTVHPGGIR